jgi:cell division protein FtsB
MDYWRIVYKFALVLLVVILPVGVACMFAPRCNALHLLQQQKTRTAEDNQQIEAQTRDFQSRQARFTSDPLYVERVARESGLVKPEEMVFRVASVSPLRVEPATNAVERVQPRPAAPARPAPRRNRG